MYLTIGLTGHTFEKIVTKRIRKEANDHVSSQNVAEFGAEPQSKKGRISGLAEGANLLECENLRKECEELRVAASSV